MSPLLTRGDILSLAEQAHEERLAKMRAIKQRKESGYWSRSCRHSRVKSEPPPPPILPGPRCLGGNRGRRAS